MIDDKYEAVAAVRCKFYEGATFYFDILQFLKHMLQKLMNIEIKCLPSLITFNNVKLVAKDYHNMRFYKILILYFLP